MAKYKKVTNNIEEKNKKRGIIYSYSFFVNLVCPH